MTLGMLFATAMPGSRTKSPSMTAKTKLRTPVFIVVSFPDRLEITEQSIHEETDHIDDKEEIARHCNKEESDKECTRILFPDDFLDS